MVNGTEFFNGMPKKWKKKSEIRDFKEQELQSRYYWMREMNATLMVGEYATIPVCEWEGERMITLLRKMKRLGKLDKKSIYCKNAIRRKLHQYDGVTWEKGFPLKRPKKKFDYYHRFFGQHLKKKAYQEDTPDSDG